jgi:hypothetical protein
MLRIPPPLAPRAKRFGKSSPVVSAAVPPPVKLANLSDLTSPTAREVFGNATAEGYLALGNSYVAASLTPTALASREKSHKKYEGVTVELFFIGSSQKRLSLFSDGSKSIVDYLKSSQPSVKGFFGLIEYSSGDTYIGNLGKYRATEGLGLFVDAAGGEYFVFFKRGCLKDGYGISRTAHGEILKGYWKEGYYVGPKNRVNHSPLDLPKIYAELEPSAQPGEVLQSWVHFYGNDHFFPTGQPHSEAIFYEIIATPFNQRMRQISDICEARREIVATVVHGDQLNFLLVSRPDSQGDQIFSYVGHQAQKFSIDALNARGGVCAYAYHAGEHLLVFDSGVRCEHQIYCGCSPGKVKEINEKLTIEGWQLAGVA